MRLLYTAKNGRLRWTKDYVCDEDLPPYAILSHTWHEEQEVTFEDTRQSAIADHGDLEAKEGLAKIHFCTQQVKRDGLDYVWVDTCCIDKSNNTELSEATKSTFRWYKNTAKCYVYLSDFCNDCLDMDGESAFRKSRWFTRGWTHQELLAPERVEFYSRTGACLDDKCSLESIIHEVTGIPGDALSRPHLSEFGVEERFTWANARQTTREEDAAYCLLGIFDVHLPLIYGEGRDKPLRRLRKEIRDSTAETSDDSLRVPMRVP